MGDFREKLSYFQETKYEETFQSGASYNKYYSHDSCVIANSSKKQMMRCHIQGGQIPLTKRSRDACNIVENLRSIFTFVFKVNVHYLTVFTSRLGHSLAIREGRAHESVVCSHKRMRHVSIYSITNYIYRLYLYNVHIEQCNSASETGPARRNVF